MYLCLNQEEKRFIVQMPSLICMYVTSKARLVQHIEPLRLPNQSQPEPDNHKQLESTSPPFCPTDRSPASARNSRRESRSPDRWDDEERDSRARRIGRSTARETLTCFDSQSPSTDRSD